MRKKLSYEISEIVPYINWLYFFHAWGLSGKPLAEKEKIRQEALLMLASWEGTYHTHGIFSLLQACGDGDDILVYLRDGDFPPGKETTVASSAKEKMVRIPMLRQQRDVVDGQPNLCLADYLMPVSLHRGRDLVGLFCTTVDGMIPETYKNDDYLSMLAQTLCDRLAEGTAERMHEEIRRCYWGYAPDEHLTMPQLLREEYRGIRPAVGYPSIPDTSVNFVLNEILEMQDVGIRLTETGMMTPHASVSGFMFAHPKARYFEVGKIGEDQLRDYARRRGIPLETMRKFLLSSLLRK